MALQEAGPATPAHPSDQVCLNISYNIWYNAEKDIWQISCYIP